MQATITPDTYVIYYSPNKTSVPRIANRYSLNHLRAVPIGEHDPDWDRIRKALEYHAADPYNRIVLVSGPGCRRTIIPRFVRRMIQLNRSVPTDLHPDAMQSERTINTDDNAPF